MNYPFSIEMVFPFLFLQLFHVPESYAPNSFYFILFFFFVFNYCSVLMFTHSLPFYTFLEQNRKSLSLAIVFDFEKRYNSSFDNKQQKIIKEIYFSFFFRLVMVVPMPNLPNHYHFYC